MPDLNLEIGASDGASEIFRKVGEAALKMSQDLGETKSAAEEATKGFDMMAAAQHALGNIMSELATKGFEVLRDVLKDSIEGFAQQDKADRQLSASLQQLGYKDVPQMTAALKEQAGKFQDLYGVQNEAVESLQQLMIRYGVAPQAIEKTTQAVLDYSAATGTDAASATQVLLRAVENGSDRIGRMGVTIKATGDKTKDLDLAVDGLSKKFGGAAASEAESYTGQMRKLSVEFGELEKSLGAVLVGIEQRTHIVSDLAEAFRGLNTMMNGGDSGSDAATIRAVHLNDTMEKRISLVAQLRMAEGQRMAALDPTGSVARAAEASIAKLNAELDAVDAVIARIKREQGEASIPLPGKSEEAEKDNHSAKYDKLVKEGLRIAAEQEKQRIKDQENHNLDIEMAHKWAKENDEQEEQNEKKEQERRTEEFVSKDINWKKVKETEGKRQGQMLLDATGNVDADLKATKKAMETGGAIGSAFITALQGQFSNLKPGESLDLGKVIKEMLPTLLGFALAATPLAPFAPLISGAAGLLLSAFHSGGYVDGMPRYHSGGLMEDEVPAILQRGEYVVNRGDVASNGGPGGVKQALRGNGGGGNVYISATDALSFRDYVTGRGGSAMVKSVNSGTGEFAQLLRRKR